MIYIYTGTRKRALDRLHEFEHILRVLYESQAEDFAKNNTEYTESRKKQIEKYEERIELLNDIL